MFKKRLEEIVEQSYYILNQKIASKGLKIDNEPSFQLQLAYILKQFGELYEFSVNDKFLIELENTIELSKKSMKSNSRKARVDILLTLGNSEEQKKCAIELKFFKKVNHREPNNRYDVFKDLSNLELYKENGIDLCYFILATDHNHYINQKSYSLDTKDFDFRDGKQYLSHQLLEYRTKKPYGLPISLKQDYFFAWDKYDDINFLKVEV